ncbi:hypothetical protein NW762_004774 [Fusarium torreyae]|uniref:Flo11 n=1 Tax=Fusarium torreyae TaxID=1237075 RepID=A0A9W8S6F6_9HYPO|nr:hypothetical protein NW762_004774 [Fusarium torreyae]
MATSNGDPAVSRPTSGIISPRDVRSRTQSISSDRPSTIAHSLMSPPLSVSPAAAFIAASAASQIVTNDHDSHADTWYDQHGIEPASDPVLVSTEALQLVNNFLDQLLFNFLSRSHATTLANLRPAVSEVLKPKLAKDAVNNADEELREYLGEGDEEDYVQLQGDKARDWDVELVWKRTRLRCMVYSSLGDMEEEDEDLYMEQENLEIGANEQAAEVISPAVAIFLTSVLEYMGELTLTVAGQAAYHRLQAKFQKEINEGTRNPTDVADRIVVEEQDMERVALDRTLGRLWRGWKKRIRSPVIDLNGRPFSRASNSHLRQDSVFSDSPALSRVATRDAEAEAHTEAVQPSEIALPMGNKDVEEIEVPGLAYYSDDDDDEEEEVEEEISGRRPKSLLILPLGITQGLPTPTLSQPNTPDFTGRKRSNSLPTPGASPYRATIKRSKEVVPVEASAVGEKQEVPESTKTDETATEQPKEVEEDKPKGEPTAEPVAPKSKRLSKIITSRIQSRQENLEDDPTYEKAEILTSSRVSVAGSASPALSDTGGPFPLKRSSSVHSARIIDVTGPKSPSGSRSPSIDTADRIRRASLTIPSSSGLSNGVSAVEPQVPRVPSPASRPVAAIPKSRSPVDAMRGSISSAATISESDEEIDRNRTREQRAHKYIAYQPSTPTVPEASSPTESKRPQAIVVPPHHSPKLQQSSSGTKVTSMRSGSASEAVPEERAADAPRKASGYSNRQASRNEKAPTSPTHSIGMVSIERSKTKDSDEDGGTAQTPRPIHTSGSSASSGTSRLKAVRTSEDNGSNRSNMARNFEELIQSNQTITYTLTPENMRNMDQKQSLDNSSTAKGPRKSEDTRAHNRSRSSSAATDVKRPSTHHRPSVGDDRMKPLPLPNSSRPRMSAAPRDARVPSESTADFAEFIKSTGPAGDSRPTQLRNVSSPTTPAKTSLDSRRVSSTSNRNRYMPREAVMESRNGSSDLIDFIRQGPPGAHSNRIPHNIAPWDTNDAAEPSGGKAVDANIPDIRYSQASTYGTDTSMPSIHSSINSNTALLKNKAQPAPTSKMFDDDDDMMPKRKTRRVKDPYAIDFSDEDDDELLTTPKPPVKKEESLAEFLMNYEPPPEPVTTPISQKVPKKKASAPSLIGRFTRKESNHSSTVPASTLGNDTRSLSSRSGFRNYIPIQVSVPSGYDKYGMPTGGDSTRPSQPVSSASSGRRVPMKKFEPREAVSNVSRTSDLASFLRDSEPPPEPVIAAPPKEESSSGLSKMFSRRKK